MKNLAQVAEKYGPSSYVKSMSDERFGLREYRTTADGGRVVLGYSGLTNRLRLLPKDARVLAEMLIRAAEDAESSCGDPNGNLQKAQ